MLLGDDIGESREGTKVEFTLGDIDLDQPTAVLSQLNIWLNDEEKHVPHIDLGLYLIRKRQQELEEVEISDWTTTDVFFMNHIHTCFAHNKRKKEQVGWKIRNSLLNVVNGKVPVCGMDWQNTYKVYAPCMLTKYKHWVAVMIDLVKGEIKVIDFYEEGVYANDCSRDWWCSWPIKHVDVPQQSNQ
ncbi:hypothetical protein L3X38_005286 [Prunus dulcis]|uniref:Ubiquitin-like protease family profile domain-containing protein n=1 Tax=Prunus dulcis TaxID=3755 RepID=A0AAD4ZQM9_PRUDU|nr:hypothetical protein L3X38_005286 [Prunus dulcis]